ncbi:FAD-dependent oxidoreductase [Nocardia brasiliensis]|uniref:FAD-dependent oxidoreductase n=1 Tax=Nocardia brasiliensis TaxID=37326 RepID=UPI0024577560|nr:hypothetical protein [Nocardia brasiliensis]
MVGAGITGLAVAAAISPYFESVVLVERDTVPEGEGFRPGVPQARHPHGLFVRGAQALEVLLPGLLKSMEEDGSPTFDLGEHTDMRIRGRTPHRLTLDLQMQTFTRNFLEYRMRRRVLNIPGIELKDGLVVSGLLHDATSCRIVGIEAHETHSRAAGANFPRAIYADLVVDASGRTSKLAHWLSSIGYKPPPPVISDSGLTYVSCVYPSAELLTPTCQFAYEFGGTKGAAALEVENGRMMLLMIGTKGDSPPTNYEGFVEWSKGLTNPIYTKIASSAQPESGMRFYGLTSNRRFNYHQMRRWPERLIVVGDAQCSFNPVYGQGMTIGILNALALRDALARNSGTLDRFSRPFQRRVARMAFEPWMLAISQDAAYVQSSSDIPWSGRIASWYIGRVLDRIPDNPDLYRTFLQVFQMTRSPRVLLRPRWLRECITHPTKIN